MAFQSKDMTFHSKGKYFFPQFAVLTTMGKGLNILRVFFDGVGCTSQFGVCNEGLVSFSIYDKDQFHMRQPSFWILKFNFLTLIWVGFLVVHIVVGVWGEYNYSCLKLVIIMLETWNLVHKYTCIFSFRQYAC